MEIPWQNISIAVSIVVSLSSLAIVVYKEFIQDYELHSAIDVIYFLKMFGDNKKNAIGEIIIRDVLSDNPSPSGQQLLAEHDPLQVAVQRNNIDQTKQILQVIFQQNNFNYNLPENIFREIIEEGLVPISFYCPLQIFNSGRKHCHISNLIMILQSCENPENKWGLSAMMEFDAQKFIDFDSIKTDVDRFQKVFSGITIPPQSGERTDPLFIPFKGEEVDVPEDPPTFGEYQFTIYGYDTLGEKVLEIGPEKINLDFSHYQEAFKGVDTLQMLSNAQHVDKALRENS